MSKKVIVVGAGHAAGQVAVSLRQKGFDGAITLVGEEAYAPYQRPPLSKAFLAGELDANRLMFKPERYYPEHNIELELNTRVESIDRENKSVALSSGKQLDYDWLVLTTGSRVRKAPIPGSELANVHYLRNITDVEAIRSGLTPGSNLVIVGAGYIGLEVAAIAKKGGLNVTVLEMAERPLQRAVAPELSDFYTKLHTDAGVDLRCNVRIESFSGSTAVTGVNLKGAAPLPADIVIIGIGILPNTELAEAAGLTIDNGIAVDEFCRTEDPSILSAGDCTSHPNRLLGRRLRLESVHNALEQAKTVACTICGEPVEYAQIPWFWSDQYDIKLQIVGLSEGYDTVILRGEPASKHFAAFYLKGNKLLSVDAINSAREFMLAKKLLAKGAELDVEQLKDMSIPFKDIATAALA
ncbi:MAG: FAD-dependent oxidoreductase [Chromatiales bacterium]|jgi:3-phenylpropionate/trans-cinnamate dioxygenase ferredoxin reductase component|nr:FAD-dependent oxidoreductase [Chromatiales bacterium]